MFKVQLRKFVLTLLAVGVVAFLVPASTQAQTLVRDVDAAAATHVGRKTSEMVSLSGLFDTNNQVFFMRTLPNGKVEEFKIPKGQALVITDIHWLISSGNPGTVTRLALTIENLENPIFSRLVYQSVLTLNSAGVNNSNERLTTGILVSSEARIKAKFTIPSGAFDTLFLIGYLVPEE